MTHALKLAFALAAGTSLLPTLAFAHTTLLQTEAAAGQSFKAVFAVPHGCAGQATIELHVRLPEGFVGAKPMPKAGWTLAIAEAPFAASYEVYGEAVAIGPVEIRWTGGRLDDAWYDEFTVRGTFAGFPAERTVAFPVTQLCADGSTVAWDETAPAGTNPHDLAHPAPTVTVHPEGADGGHVHHGAAAAAGMAKVGALVLTGGFARAMLPGQPVGGGYLTIRNEGPEADRLLSVETKAAARGEIHEMTMRGDVMTMRPLAGGIEIPAGGTVELAPGGTHLMFSEVAAPFAQGATVPVTLTFATAGKVEMTLPVLGIAAKDASAAHADHAMPGMTP